MNWLVGTPAAIADQVTALERRHGIPRDPEHRGRRCPPAPFGRVERYCDIVEAVDGRAAANIDSADRALDGVSQPINGRSVVIATRDAGPLPADFTVRDVIEPDPRETPTEPPREPAGRLSG